MKQTRVLCNECKREWLEPKYLVNSSAMTITGNRRDDLCPICGSGQIEMVEYTPSFLGGDIPRPDSPIIPVGLPDDGDDREPDNKPRTPGYIQPALTLI